MFISKPDYIKGCLDSSDSFWKDFSVTWKQVVTFSCGRICHDDMEYDSWLLLVHLAQDKGKNVHLGMIYLGLGLYFVEKYSKILFSYTMGQIALDWV